MTCAGLIVSIGAQNAFVLKQGLKGNYLFITALFCVFVDALLITVGVGGMGVILTSSPLLFSITKWGGAAFLFWYGFRSFRSAFRTSSMEVQPDAESSLREVLLTLAAVSFLNPHVYLDTVMLLGSIGARFEGEKVYFAIGAIFASILWFFGLCYGARLLAPLFAKPLAWKITDGCIGLMMWSLAFTLLF